VVHKYLIMKEGKCISLLLSKFPRVFIFKEEAPRWPKRYVYILKGMSLR